jgi:hypothetical protein
VKIRIVAWLVAFLVIFNLGYVFHEIVVHDFLTARIGAIARSSYVIPLIALSFALYVAILVYLYPIFLAYYGHRWHPIAVGAWMGGLMGFLWDGLQGGLIEVATFRMPASVFVVDSSYHTLEGVLAGVLVAVVFGKMSARVASDVRQPA